MNRNIVTRELGKVGVTLTGWVPVFRCDSCGERWSPFHSVEETAAPTVRFDYWQCPKGCNRAALPSDALRIISPRFVEVRGIPGVLFGNDDLPEFERYVRSMDVTQVPDAMHGAGT